MVKLVDYDKIDRLMLRTKREEDIVRFLDNVSVGSINDCTPKAGRVRNENRITVTAPFKTQVSTLSTTQILKIAHTQLSDSRKQVQIAACSIIKLVLQNGDIKLMRRCLKKLEVVIDTEPLIKFFCTFAPIAINDKGVISYVHERKKECADSFSLCMSTPWWECT